MTRRFTILTAALAAALALLVGLVVGGSGRTVNTAALASAAARPSAGRPGGQSHTQIVNFADIAARVNPAVVYVESVSVPRADRRDVPRGSLGPDRSPGSSDRDSDRADRDSGSGFVITADGEILTNHHVVDGADRIIVTLADGRSLRARVLGADPDTDVALIKVDGVAGLPIVEMGDSAALRVGEWVCAIGNPLGYEHTVTVGVVSYVGRKLFDEGLDDYIQTDAAIDFGNSGGPLIDDAGRVIGINAAVSSEGNSIGFAVPINQARQVLGDLRRRGRVVRGYIGVGLVDIDPDVRRSLRLGESRGVLVEDVTPDSPGERAGLQRYDVIAAVDGARVLTPTQLIRDIAARSPGSRVSLRVVRDGHEQAVSVQLGERPARVAEDGRPAGRTSPAGAETGPAIIGLSVEDLSRHVRSQWRLPASLSGVMVSGVVPSSPADDAELRRGDVIIEINRAPVRSAVEYRALAAGVRPGDALALFLYDPRTDQRSIRTLRIDPRQ